MGYKFKTYNLTKSQIKHLAGVSKQEQGTSEGAKAELSLIANRFESQSTYSKINDYVRFSGWFASSSKNRSTSETKYVNAVKQVLINGDRTLPPTINEHDWIGDIVSVTNNGKKIDKNKRSKYIQGVSIIKNRFGSTYTFYCFPTPTSDPFGYTNTKKHKAWIKKYAEKGKLYYKSDSSGVGGSGTSNESGNSLQVSPEKLYTSNNYAYIQANTTKSTITNLSETVLSNVKNLLTGFNSLGSLFENTTEDFINNKLSSNTIKDEVLKINLIDTKERVVSKTIQKGVIDTSVLPVVSTLIEAPYFEIDINGVKFGGYHKRKIPNYVKSLQVKKVNGSINEYNIQLIHQIEPGNNPNYVDMILSSIGYNIISIKYGNANTGQIFIDNKALITNITQKFDFINCNIIYNINALSLVAATAAQRYNFPAFQGKISDKIRQMLWGTVDSELLKVFPGMANQANVERLGLIPVNDKVITMGAQTNVTVLGYLLQLVSRMENATTSEEDEVLSSIYLLSIDDNTQGSTFKITEVTNNVNSIPYIYEVNVGYPDDNFVLNFSVKNNFAWAVAYESSKNIVRYDYELDAIGNLNKQKVPAYYLNEEDKLGNRNLWTSLTRFPIDATLTIRGLLQDSLLMQYIKINCIMYGSKRITSGVYIVTEQNDIIGNGIYTTELSLMRVAGDEEYITIDGRKVT